MSITLTFEHPQFPPDYEFGFNDLGIVKNGGTLELDEEQERLFIARKGMTVEDAFKDDGIVKLSGSSTLTAEEIQLLLPPQEVEVVDQSNESDVDNHSSGTGDNVVPQPPAVETPQTEEGDQ